MIGAVACGEPDLEQGDGRDPDQTAMDAGEPLVVGAAEMDERGLVDGARAAATSSDSWFTRSARFGNADETRSRESPRAPAHHTRSNGGRWTAAVSRGC